VLNVACITVLLLTPLCVALAYALGRHVGQHMTIPWRPIFQLVDHRQRCLGHDRGRVQREIGALVPVPAWAWDELLAMRRPLGGVAWRRRVTAR
jgi:hypothetical protein